MPDRARRKPIVKIINFFGRNDMKIAIDGLSGVGKSTYAKMLAKEYGLK